jgi:hypothetical protein
MGGSYAQQDEFLEEDPCEEEVEIVPDVVGQVQTQLGLLGAGLGLSLVVGEPQTLLVVLVAHFGLG